MWELGLESRPGRTRQQVLPVSVGTGWSMSGWVTAPIGMRENWIWGADSVGESVSLILWDGSNCYFVQELDGSCQARP